MNRWVALGLCVVFVGCFGKGDSDDDDDDDWGEASGEAAWGDSTDGASGATDGGSGGGDNDGATDGGSSSGGGSSGGGGDAMDANQPVALCEVSPDKVRPITGDATWIGSDSYDPNDLGLVYEWSLDYRPEGSAADMPDVTSLSSHRFGFIPDLAGEYIARLVVTNSDGLHSEPCEATLIAEPAEALWVEMFWENAGDDMDLHLLSPEGIGDADGDGLDDGIETDQDCYFSNCSVSTYSAGLDWGVIGDPIDDPILDLDDISEAGPENINLDNPQDTEVLGRPYRVAVHYYRSNAERSNLDYGPSTATLRVYLGGDLVEEYIRQLRATNDLWEVVNINWPSGVLDAVDLVLNMGPGQ